MGAGSRESEEDSSPKKIRELRNTVANAMENEDVVDLQ
jgi:hypothetical protein